MRKGALKKKRRQLEELHLDRCEALGELVLGMYVQGSWDEDVMSRGAAEVQEVADELDALSAPFPEPDQSAEHDLPPTGEYTAEHSLPETSETTGVHAVAESGGSETQEQSRQPAAAARPPVPEPGQKEPEAAVRPSTRPAAPAGAKPPRAQDPKADIAKPGAPKVDAGKNDRAKADSASDPKPPEGAKPSPEPGTSGSPSSPSPTSSPAVKTGAIPSPAAPAPPVPVESKEAATWQRGLSELDLLDGKIGKSLTEARTAAEAAKAAAAADSRTELSVITREIESNRANLAAALTAAAKRITDAEKRADEAEAKVARDSAANREAAAGWVRSQAAEIEADAALAAEITAGPGTGAPSGADTAPGQPELEARIRSLEASLEAEKASKIEALTVAESRLKAIEESAREAEKRVEEAEASLSEAGTAPVAVEAASGIVTEAEAREAAVVWLRGQIAALRKEIAKDEPTESKGGS